MTRQKKMAVLAAVAVVLILAAVFLPRILSDNKVDDQQEEQNNDDLQPESPDDAQDEEETEAGSPPQDAGGDEDASSEPSDPENGAGDTGQSKPLPPEENGQGQNESQTPPEVTPDENGMMQVGETWIEDPGELSQSSVESFAKKLNELKGKYLSGASSVWYSVIPDKSNFAPDTVKARLDHNEMISKLTPLLSDWNYIEIGNLLSLDDYLLTDGHWRQERIVPVANAIASKLGYSVSKGEFTEKSKDGFSGDYGKYSGSSEKITWLVSSYTSGSSCDNFQRPESTLVYDESLLNTSSPYDIFVGGPTPLVTITNPLVTNGKRLVVFRDSFGSSLAPLLLSGYSEITLVDIRYMVSDLLPQYVDFTSADVLFLYSARVVNNSSMLR